MGLLSGVALSLFGGNGLPARLLGELRAIMPRSNLFAQTSANERRRGNWLEEPNSRRFFSREEVTAAAVHIAVPKAGRTHFRIEQTIRRFQLSFQRKSQRTKQFLTKQDSSQS
jgi:hypothetical protein